MVKLLITGANGFFAQKVSDSLNEKYQIIKTGIRDYIPLDVTDLKNCDRVFKKYKPDIVLHTAALTSTGECEENKELAFDLNFNGTENIVKVCKKYSSKLIFLSTEQVFNGNKELGPYSEKDKPVPNTYYGETKLLAEEKIKGELDDYLIFRLTWMFGLSKNKIFPNIITDVIYSKKDITVPENEYRGLSDIDELIKNWDKLMKLDKGIYHIGSENDKNRYEIIKMIIEKTNVDIKAIKRNHEKVRDIRLNTNKIKNEGIYFTNSSEAIMMCIKKYKEDIIK